jgi:hypothetical protein
MQAAIDTVLARVEKEEDVTVEHLVPILTYLRDDAILNKFLSELATEDGHRPTVDGYWDITDEIVAKFPEYDPRILNAIQGYIQNTSIFVTALVKDHDERFQLEHAAIKRLKDEGIDVFIDFDEYDDGSEFSGELYANVTYVFETFDLQT